MAKVTFRWYDTAQQQALLFQKKHFDGDKYLEQVSQIYDGAKKDSFKGDQENVMQPKYLKRLF